MLTDREFRCRPIAGMCAIRCRHALRGWNRARRTPGSSSRILGVALECEMRSNAPQVTSPLQFTRDGLRRNSVTRLLEDSRQDQELLPSPASVGTDEASAIADLGLALRVGTKQGEASFSAAFKELPDATGRSLQVRGSTVAMRRNPLLEASPRRSQSFFLVPTRDPPPAC
jgi:hypothetical protein